MSNPRSLAEKCQKGSILVVIKYSGEQECWESELSREGFGKPTGCT